MVSMVSTRLCTKNTWPPRSSSRAIASSSRPSSHGSTKVRIGERSRGGVSMSVRSRRPASDRCSVRGIGVAVSVSTSTASRSALSRSLCFTPKRCSSSTMSRPRSLKVTSGESSRWVPMMMSISPSAEPRQRRLLLLRGAEAREHLDLHRVVGQPLGEGAPVLLGEDGGRHQHRHLLAALHRLERRPHRDLGLAVPDVADEQPVHGPRLLEVALDVLGGLPLVGRVLVEEARLELALPARVGRKGIAGGELATGVEIEQLAGHLADAQLRLLAHLLPVRAAERVDPRRRAIAVVLRRAVALQLVEPVQRHVEPVAALVLHHRHFHRRRADGDRLDAAIDADAVVEVHDVVALDQRAGGGRRRRLPVAPRPPQPPRAAEDLVVGEDAEPRHEEAAVERAHDERRHAPAGCPAPRAARRAARSVPRCRRG